VVYLSVVSNGVLSFGLKLLKSKAAGFGYFVVYLSAVSDGVLSFDLKLLKSKAAGFGLGV